jgi:hypothetical protein
MQRLALGQSTLSFTSRHIASSAQTMDDDVMEAESVGASETGPCSPEFEDGDFGEQALEDLNGLMDELETSVAEHEPATQTFSTVGDFLSMSGNVPKLNK